MPSTTSSNLTRYYNHVKYVWSMRDELIRYFKRNDSIGEPEGAD